MDNTKLWQVIQTKVDASMQFDHMRVHDTPQLDPSVGRRYILEEKGIDLSKESNCGLYFLFRSNRACVQTYLNTPECQVNMNINDIHYRHVMSNILISKGFLPEQKVHCDYDPTLIA